jgi:DNA-binding transcriptional regulator YiaG
MSPILQVRKRVFGISQAELAAIANTSQGTVSKWEAGELEPDREQLALIRSAAIDRGLEWSDAWFFEPAPTEARA